LDFIEVHILGRIDSLLKNASECKLLKMRSRAEKLISELENVNQILFKKIRETIAYNRFSLVFKDLIINYINSDLYNNNNNPGYDELDAFVDGIFFQNDIPEQTKKLDPDMVFYQKTPARVVFELIKKVNFRRDDVFYDLGSGLGQVVILVKLLTDVTVKGVEIEPAFCEYGNGCVDSLNLKGVTFINADARYIDYSLGTVFFMYTPFKGQVLQEILTLIQKESLKRCITLITYGPCTPIISRQSWLHKEALCNENIYRLAVFKSRQ